MFSWLNRFTNEFFDVLYEYIKTSCELLWKPKLSIRKLCKNKDVNLITPGLYFTINIFLIQLMEYIENRMSNMGGSGISSIGGYFEIPVVGSVEGIRILNFLGHYIGAAVVLLVLAKVVNDSTVWFLSLRNIVLYSSVCILFISVIERVLYYVVTVISVFWIDDNVLWYFKNLNDANVIDNLEAIEKSMGWMIEVKIITTTIIVAMYVFYMSSYICAIIPSDSIKKVLSAFIAIIFFLLTSFSVYYPFHDMRDELRKIQSNINGVVYFNGKLERLENRKVGTIIEMRKHMLNIADYYRCLSESFLLPEQEKLMAFEMYFVLKYIDFIPVEEQTEDLCFVNYGTNMTEANGKYVDFLLKKLKYTSDAQKIISLQNSTIEEKAIKKYKSSLEIFLEKCKENRYKKFSSIVVPVSLVKILP